MQPQRLVPVNHKIMLLILGLAFAGSMIRPFDWFTWFLEVLPVAIAVSILLLIYHRFRLTNLNRQLANLLDSK